MGQNKKYKKGTVILL